jgi:hypothetical protein
MVLSSKPASYGSFYTMNTHKLLKGYIIKSNLLLWSRQVKIDIKLLNMSSLSLDCSSFIDSNPIHLQA